MTTLEGRVVRRRRALDPPPGVRTELEVLHGLAARRGLGAAFPTDPEAVFARAGPRSAGGPRRLLRHQPREARRRRGPVLALPVHPGRRAAAPRHAPPVPRPLRPPRRPGQDGAGRRDGCRRRPSPRRARLPGHGPRAAALPVGRPDSPRARASRRRRRAASSQLHPHLAGRLGIEDGDRVQVTSSRGTAFAPARISGETASGHGLHAVPLPRRRERQPGDELRYRPDQRHAGVQGLRRGRAARAGTGRGGFVTAATQVRTGSWWSGTAWSRTGSSRRSCVAAPAENSRRCTSPFWGTSRTTRTTGCCCRRCVAGRAEVAGLAMPETPSGVTVLSSTAAVPASTGTAGHVVRRHGCEPPLRHRGARDRGRSPRAAARRLPGRRAAPWRDGAADGRRRASLAGDRRRPRDARSCSAAGCSASRRRARWRGAACTSRSSMPRRT